jgi:hypothetical protein
MGPEVFLATEQQVSELLDTIAKKTETLKKEAEELYRSYSTAEGESLSLGFYCTRVDGKCCIRHAKE